MGLKNIAKILLVPMIASVGLIGNGIKVEATANKAVVVQNFYEGIINKDIESILEHSDDTRFISEEERYVSLELLINNPNETITEYEILDDGNPNDNNFLVKEYYLNGDMIENNINVEGDKVLLSMSGQPARYIKKGENIPMTEAQEEKQERLIEKRNKAAIGNNTSA